MRTAGLPALLAASVMFLQPAPANAQGVTVTTLLENGARASKVNLVIIGDGFTANDQAAYNQFVEQVVLRGIFNDVTGGVYAQTMSAYNIYRINANSVDSGITNIDANGNPLTDAAGNPITPNTFLGYRFSGLWARCWMEPGPNTNATLTSTLNAQVPGWNFAFVILNTASFGGCRRGNTLAITLGADWTVGAHEMGHMIGNLGDEYTGANTFTGTETGLPVNLTVNTVRSTLKWNQFVNPNTAIPTDAATFTGSQSDDAGLFAGGTFSGTRFNAGIFRPVINCRMNGNAPPFCPVCYDQMQSSVSANLNRAFSKVYPGRFTADNRDDVVLLNDNTLSLYSGGGDQIDQTWCRTMPDPVWDAFRPGDEFLAGDFDGDGMQDLFVYNFTDWSMPYFGMLRSTGTGFTGVRRFDRVLPGWGDMRAHDKFYVADVNADGKSDILVFNGADWDRGYLLVLISTGNNLTFMQRYDGDLPGWGAMKVNDQFYVADFNRDRRDDLYVFNGRDWSEGYLEMLRSNGRGFDYVHRYDRDLPGWGAMLANDQFYVADFDGDGRKDLYVFNGMDWSMPYLEMLKSTGTALTAARRFDGSVSNWGDMKPHDQWFVADLNGDLKDDLYVYNAQDWVTEYLGHLRSNGNNLTGGWQDNWIGSWNLGLKDQFRVANFNGGAGWQDLLVFNDGWFGLLRSGSGPLTLSALHPKWIHNHNYQANGWW